LDTVAKIGFARSVRWGVLFLALAALILAIDAWSTAKLLEKATAIATDTTPGDISQTASREHDAVLLPSALDARWYVIHAEEMLRTGSWRIRSTNLDNAPYGREVHWSGLIPWVLVALASVSGFFLDRPAIDLVQWMPYGLGLLLFCAGSAVLFSGYGRKLGWGIAGLTVLILASYFSFFDMFRAGEADHHGAASYLCLIGVTFLVLGGAGTSARGSKVREKAARGWFAISGISLASALWVSASTAVPILGAVGLGALLGIFLARQGGWETTTRLWWTWAVWGASVSIAFYLIEYFPFHLGWRLEVNHPIYAFAWLAGGWILYRVGVWRSRPPAFCWSRAEILWGGVALAAVTLPALMIAIGKAQFFAPGDRFLYFLHALHIREFAPLWKGTASQDYRGVLEVLWWPAFATAIAVFLLLRGGIPANWRAGLLLLFVVCLVASVEAAWQVRWLGLATGLWIGTTGVILALLLADLARKTTSFWVEAGVGILIFWGIASAPLDSLSTLAMLSSGNQFPKAIAPTLLLRDIGHRIARVAGDRIPTVLSDFTSSSDLAFFGGVKVLGTLYWENAEGLKRAARIFSKTTEEGTIAALNEAGINFLVVPSWDGFSDMSAYGDLLRRGGEAASTEPSYLARLVRGEVKPDWARPIPYPIPQSFGLPHIGVAIFEILPGRTRFAALRSEGIDAFEAGNWKAALKAFEQSLEIDPQNAEVKAWAEALRTRLEAASPASGM